MEAEGVEETTNVENEAPTPSTETVETTEQVEKEAKSTSATESEPKEDEKPEKEGAEPTASKKGAQARIQKLIAERNMERELRKQAESLVRGEKTEKQPELTAEHFSSFESYLTAKPDASYETYLREAAKFDFTQEQLRKEAERRNAEIADAHVMRVTKAREKYADFDEVALREDVPCSKAMYDAILESEVGPDIAYFFGQNPEEAIRISRLPWQTAMREIGRIETKFLSSETKETPKKPMVSQAPEPISTVKGSGHQADMSKLPIGDWIKKRNEEEAKRRQ